MREIFTHLTKILSVNWWLHKTTIEEKVKIVTSKNADNGQVSFDHLIAS